METIIKKKLEELEQRENIQIIMAGELGNKAWGFSSPNNNHCIRLIYKRSMNDYLRLDSLSDTIKWNPEKELDICGWDLRKVLLSLYASKPVMFELLNSPIIYRTSDTFLKLKELSKKYFLPQKSLQYYYQIASSHYQEYLEADHIRIRDYFHVLRPLLAAKWILVNDCPPPLDFSELLNTEFPEGLRKEVDKLITLKNKYSKLNYALKIVTLNEYIEEMLELFKEKGTNCKEQLFDWDELNQFFLDEIK